MDRCYDKKWGVLGADFTTVKNKKNTFFQKRTGEVIENKEPELKNEPERTGKRTGEVVENT